MPTPALAESSSASRRVRIIRLDDSDMNDSPYTHRLAGNRANVSTSITGFPVSCQKIPGRKPTLFGQSVLAIDMEMTADVWCSGTGLAASDADRVISLRDDWI